MELLSTTTQKSFISSSMFQIERSSNSATLPFNKRLQNLSVEHSGVLLLIRLVYIGGKMGRLALLVIIFLAVGCGKKDSYSFFQVWLAEDASLSVDATSGKFDTPFDSTVNTSGGQWLCLVYFAGNEAGGTYSIGSCKHVSGSAYAPDGAGLYTVADHVLTLCPNALNDCKRFW
jgi:hypothetical protein